MDAVTARSNLRVNIDNGIRKPNEKLFLGKHRHRSVFRIVNFLRKWLALDDFRNWLIGEAA